MAPQQPEQEQGPFFVVETAGGPRPNYEVMSMAEVDDAPESVQLVSGHFNTRAEAEAHLRSGSYKQLP